MPYREKAVRDILVKDVFDKIVKEPAVVGRNASIKEVVDQMITHPLSRKAYVIDDQRKYLGTVNTETILRMIGYRIGIRDARGLSFFRYLRDALKEDAGSIMAIGRVVTRETSLAKAMQIMLEDHLNDLPVVDDEGRLIGELVSLEIFLEARNLFGEEDHPRDVPI